MEKEFKKSIKEDNKNSEKEQIKKIKKEKIKKMKRRKWDGADGIGVVFLEKGKGDHG